MRQGGTHAQLAAGWKAVTTASATSEFAEVFAAHHAEALRLAFLLCGDPHRAEDVTADAFVKLYRRWSRGGIDNPRAYLRRTVVNEVNSKFRRLALERREASKLSGDDRGVLAADDRLADSDAVARALAALPRRQRTAVVLRYYADLPEREAAEVMGVSVGTVKSSVFRGLEKMKAVLSAEVGG